MNDPVHVATIPRNREEEIRVALSEYKGVHLLDLRTYAAFGGADERRPTKKGVTVRLDRLDDLIDALALARERAVKLRMLEG